MHGARQRRRQHDGSDAVLSIALIVAAVVTALGWYIVAVDPTKLPADSAPAAEVAR